MCAIFGSTAVLRRVISGKTPHETPRGVSPGGVGGESRDPGAVETGEFQLQEKLALC